MSTMRCRVETMPGRANAGSGQRRVGPTPGRANAGARDLLVLVCACARGRGRPIACSSCRAAVTYPNEAAGLSYSQTALFGYSK